MTARCWEWYSCKRIHSFARSHLRARCTTSRGLSALLMHWPTNSGVKQPHRTKHKVPNVQFSPPPPQLSFVTMWLLREVLILQEKIKKKKNWRRRYLCASLSYTTPPPPTTRSCKTGCSIVNYLKKPDSAYILPPPPPPLAHPVASSLTLQTCLHRPLSPAKGPAVCCESSPPSPPPPPPRNIQTKSRDTRRIKNTPQLLFPPHPPYHITCCKAPPPPPPPAPLPRRGFIRGRSPNAEVAPLCMQMNMPHCSQCTKEKN